MHFDEIDRDCGVVAHKLCGQEPSCDMPRLVYGNKGSCPSVVPIQLLDLAQAALWLPHDQPSPSRWRASGLRSASARSHEGPLSTWQELSAGPRSLEWK